MPLRFSIIAFAIACSLLPVACFAQKQNNVSIKGKIINNSFKTIYLDKYTDVSTPV